MSRLDIISDSLVPGTESVFFLGCFESRVTLYAQQVRALNLVDAILAQQLVRPNGRVAIVGGGVAGVTAAAAFALAGPQLQTVDLFEVKKELLHLQRSGADRYLHPHLYDWPAPHARRTEAGLPLLNWEAGSAGDVASDLLKEFATIKGIRPILHEKLDLRVAEVKPATSGAGCFVSVEGAANEGAEYDVVVLSIGFGYERNDQNTPSYWMPFPIAPGSIKAPGTSHHVLVSGNGDGGLVDFQKVTFNQSHREIIEFLTGYKGLKKAQEKLLEIEDAAWNDADVDLHEAYRELVLPVLPRYLLTDVREKLRRDVHVWLHTREKRLFRRDTAVLNRFGTFLVIEADRDSGRSSRMIRVCRGVELPHPDALGALHFPGEDPFVPKYQFLRFGADREAILDPFLPLAQALPSRSALRTVGLPAPTPALTSTARKRFQRLTAAVQPVETAPSLPNPPPRTSKTKHHPADMFARDPQEFELPHGRSAMQRVERTVRRQEVQRLLYTMRQAAANPDGLCGLVMVVGPCGSGKSILMAQAFKERKRALYFSMDDPPQPAGEPASRERRPHGAPPNHDELMEGSSDAVSSARGGVARPHVPTRGGEALRTATIAVPVRMHWLAGACRLAGKPQPRAALPAGEASRQITELLRSIADPADPVYIFIDAVNQVEAPDSYDVLLSGLRPEQLPAGIVIVISTQESEEVMQHLREMDGGPHDWKPLYIEQLKAYHETVALMLNDWPEHLPPVRLPDALTAELHEKVDGLPINAWGWGVRLQQLVESDGDSAVEAFWTELKEAKVGFFPDAYLDRLLTQLDRGFRPAGLPRAVGWYLALMRQPVTRDEIYDAHPALKFITLDPRDVSRDQIDAALDRLSGFLISERVGSARRWRLRNESLHDTWLNKFGRPELTEVLMNALLPFGVIPPVDRWSPEECQEWVGFVTERSTRYERLSAAQSAAVLQGLLDRIASGSLPRVAHRAPAIRQKQGVLEYKAGKMDLSGQIAQDAVEELRARTAEENSREIQADLLFDLGNAVSHAAWFSWFKEQKNYTELYEESVRWHHAAAQLCPERWSPLRAARLMRTQNDVTLGLTDSERALNVLSEAIALGSTLPQELSEVRAALAGCYSSRGYRYARLERNDEAIADYDAAVAIFDADMPTLPDNRESFANVLFNRALEQFGLGRIDEALEGHDRAIALYQELDQTAQVRESLANAYAARADCNQRLERTEAVVADRLEAAALMETVDHTPERQFVLGLALRGAARGMRELGRLDEAGDAYARAINVLAPLSKSWHQALGALQDSYIESASIRRMQGRNEEALAAYRQMPEVALLKNNSFGVLFESMGGPGSDSEPLAKISELATFLNFAPLPEEHMAWARERLGLAGDDFADLRHRVTFRIAPLSFYADGYLLVAEDTSRAGRAELFALCRLGKEVSGLDWTNGPIYDANTRWEIHLDDDRVRDYCRFFFHFVYGRYGPFTIFERIDELPWNDKATSADFERVRLLSAPISLLPSTEPGVYRLDSRMLFKDAVFSATISVVSDAKDPSQRGLISLSEEAMIGDELPVHEAPLPYLRDIPVPPEANPEASAKVPRQSPLVVYRNTSEEELLRKAQYGVLLHGLGKEDPVQERLPRVSDEARFLTFEPLPEHHLGWAYEILGLTGVEFTRVRERLQFRVAPLAFYRAGYLLATEDRSRRGPGEMFALCRLGEELVGLDWTDKPIYGAANASLELRLDTDDQVVQYCRFFMHFVHDKRGVSRIFENVTELPWTAAATDRDVARVQAICTPVTVRATTPEIVQLKARLLRNRSIFSATIQVHLEQESGSRGRVTLCDEVELLKELPVHLPVSPYIRDHRSRVASIS